MTEGKEGADEDLLVDTSKMNDAQRQTMEVAEAAREKEWKHPSFASELFMGTFRHDMLFPFPTQNAEEKKEVEQFVSTLKDYLEKHLDPDEVDRTRTIPQEVITKMAEMGVFAMKVPKKYGGLGFSQVSYNRVMLMLGSYCASTAVLVSAHQSIGVPQPLKLFGTEEQKQQFMPRFREGAISAFALTEPGVGSDPARMTTKAELTEDGSHYIINGEKLWCTNGPIADIIVVMAETKPKIVKGKERKQISAFIVETTTPGISVKHRCEFLGLAAINNGWLQFDNVKVPAENLLWGEGRGLALALVTLNTGRLTIPAASAGAAKQCLSFARRWANEREQWGKAIGYHEACQDKIARIASTTLAIEAITWLTSHWADRKDLDIRIEAAMAKMFCSEATWQIVDETLQLRGGRGYETADSLKARGEAPYPIERMLRDVRINTIIEGTSDIMRLFLAREAMDPHFKQLKKALKARSMGEKLKAGVDMFSFYSSWYAKRLFNGSYFSSYSDKGPLGKHLRYIEKTSHKLARVMFQYMALYQQKLENKQILLGDLVDIGTQLFAMAATCSYALSISQSRGGDRTVLDTAGHFCQGAQRCIEEHFRSLSKSMKLTHKVSDAVLEGQLRWLEAGTLPIGPDA